MNTITTTYLQMTDRAQFQPKVSTDPLFKVTEAPDKQWRLNRFLYKLVGEPWTWYDKLSWNEDQWRSYAEDDRLRTFVAYHDGVHAGYFELSNHDNEVEIAYFGLARDFIGKGLGGPLLSRAIEEAWNMNPGRVWVHTCTLDHPHAINNYLARGMVIYKTETQELTHTKAKI